MSNKIVGQNWCRASFVLLLTILALLMFRVLGLDKSLSTLVSPDPTPTPASTPEVTQLVPSPAPAIHAFLWWDAAVAERDLYIVQEGMHFYWVKQMFSWRDIEGFAKGSFDWRNADRVVEQVEKRGLFLLARLDREPYWARDNSDPAIQENGPPANYQDFGDYCFAVADRYRGRIKAYQVWNEPNLAREWGGKPPNPAEYTRLLATCYEGIKRGDPNAIVISAGLAPTGTSLPSAIPDDEFFKAMYAAGASDYFDMLGVNAPGYAAPPEASPDDAANTPEWSVHRWARFRHVEDIRAMMVAEGDGHKQISILEMGWTTDTVHDDYRWHSVTQEQQAEYLLGAYWWARLHWRPWIGIMTTIYLPDVNWTPDDEQYWWAVIEPEYPATNWRPALKALFKIPDWSNGFYDQWYLSGNGVTPQPNK
ncbi:MAG: hypothetical protein JXB07_20565 [Anaerolineae bacterium]|nr:hypothetical protein [Anaerolineae bacterium]